MTETQTSSPQQDQQRNASVSEASETNQDSKQLPVTTPVTPSTPIPEPKKLGLPYWTTEIGPSAGGMILIAVINYALNSLSATAQSLGELMMLDLASVVILVATIYYAVKVYPSYFSDKPLLTSSSTISFLNGLFGGIIFGCLWNYNLTNEKMGVSYIVVTIMCGLGLLLYGYELFLINSVA